MARRYSRNTYKTPKEYWEHQSEVDKLTKKAFFYLFLIIIVFAILVAIMYIVTDNEAWLNLLKK